MENRETGEGDTTDTDGGFSHRLLTRLESLSQMLEHAGEDDLEKGSRLAHQLRGTAASFGYQGVGDLLRTRFRLEDLRGRWGGEEFVLAFAGQTLEFGHSIAARLLQDFSQTAFATEDGGEFHATFTAGVAAFPGDGESLDLLIKRADQRLYRGKEAGRGCVISAD